MVIVVLMGRSSSTYVIPFMLGFVCIERKRHRFQMDSRESNLMLTLNSC